MSQGPGDAVDLRQLRRALLIKLRHHGDVLLTSPVFSVLKARAPSFSSAWTPRPCTSPRRCARP
jgi:hypothetical protein